MSLSAMALVTCYLIFIQSTASSEASSFHKINHKFLLYLESQRQPQAKFLMSQTWKRIVIGRMPDPMR